MVSTMRTLLYAGVATAAMLAVGCGGESDEALADAGTNVGVDGGMDAGQVASGPVPNFSLTDTNSTSPYAGQAVSPRQFMQQVTGWYFTHAS